MAGTVQRNALVANFSVRDRVTNKEGKLEVTHQKWFTQAQQAINGSAQITATIPAHSGSPGQPGQIAIGDPHFVYVCIGLNTWVRFPVVAF